MAWDALKAQIRAKDDDQLRVDLGLGPEAYQAGIYDLYLAEAVARGWEVSPNELQNLTTEQKSVDLETESRQLAIVGFLVLFVFAGLFAFMPGLSLLKKDQAKQPVFGPGKRRLGKFFIAWSIGAWALGLGAGVWIWLRSLV